MKEDYLKTIFELGGSHKKVSNKETSLGLGIVAGSVTEMTSKLADEGLIVHEPCAGISLTEKGQKYTAELVRRHRLWETSLVDKLHYNFADAHSEAEILEYQTSDRLATALDAFLQHPDHCPHGGVIPSANGKFPDVTYRLLADADDEEKAELEQFLDSHELLTYLEELGLRPQEQVTVIHREPFEGPVVIQREDNDQEINILYKASRNISIEPDTVQENKG